MSKRSLDLSGKIEHEIVVILGEVSRIASSLDIPFFVIGATARDIVLEDGFGIHPLRATRDLDLGVQVGDWQEFLILSQGLIESGSFTEAFAAQRFIHLKSNLPVDIVPFGKIDAGKNVISWPPDHAVLIDISGFEEAYAHAWPIRLESDLEINFASPAGWALLKIISWNDRDPSVRGKDAQDLALILKNYFDAGNVDRLYGEESALLESENYDLELAGARLLGRDLAYIAKAATLESILEIFERETNDQSQYQLVTDMAPSRMTEDDVFERHLQLLQKMKLGISEGS